MTFCHPNNALELLLVSLADVRHPHFFCVFDFLNSSFEGKGGAKWHENTFSEYFESVITLEEGK